MPAIISFWGTYTADLCLYAALAMQNTGRRVCVIDHSDDGAPYGLPTAFPFHGYGKGTDAIAPFVWSGQLRANHLRNQSGQAREGSRNAAFVEKERLHGVRKKGMGKMNVAFWSEEDGCGTTSGMAAIASVCSTAWNMKTILMQSLSREGDLRKKLEAAPPCDAIFGNRLYYALTGLDYLLWRGTNGQLDEEMVQNAIVPVGKGGMYYLPSGEGERQLGYHSLNGQKDAMRQIIQLTGRLSDLTFIDCGSGQDAWSEYFLEQADVVVINFSQERHAVDAYFQNKHAFRGKVVYLINCYSPESICNKANLRRIYRPQEEIAVIPHNPYFRHAGDKGKLGRFVHRHIRGGIFDRQFYFMQELMRTAAVILRAAGFAL